MTNMAISKRIVVTQKIHAKLRCYLAENGIQTFNEGIEALLEK